MRNLTSAHVLARINDDHTQLFLLIDGEPELTSKEKRIHPGGFRDERDKWRYAVKTRNTNGVRISLHI